MTNESVVQSVDQEIRQFYHELTPERRFVQQLEQDLLARRRQMPGERWPGGLQRRRAHFRWALVPATLIVVLAVVVIAIGPRTVLSAILGNGAYIPGIGFFYAPTTRVLAEPVVVALSPELDLHIEQLVAGVDRTVVSVSLTGQRANIETWETLSDPEQVRVSLVHPKGYHYRAMGTERQLSDTSAEGVSGYWIFTQLPQSMNPMTLELTASGEAASLLLAEEMITVGLTVAPVSPGMHASEIVQVQRLGITSHTGPAPCKLLVHQAAYAADNTGVDVDVHCGQGMSGLFMGHGMPGLFMRELLPVLIDDTGRIYTPSLTTSDAYQPIAGRQTWNFPALPTEAKMVTLRANTLYISDRTSAWRTAFILDLGPDPQVGHAWPLEIELGSEGAPFRLEITGAELREFTVDWMYEGEPPLYQLDLTLEVRELAPGVKPDSFSGTSPLRPPFVRDGYAWHWGGRITEPNDAPLTIHSSLALWTLPTEPFTLTLDGVQYELAGPWEVTWPVERTP